LSGLVGLSAHHFCRVFKQSTGLPPHRWQVRQRVEKAKVLMLDADLSLAEIAVATGFADQSHFTTVFRKATGSPPHAWRRERNS
jgi:AraC-like DNA-binding protein